MGIPRTLYFVISLLSCGALVGQSDMRWFFGYDADDLQNSWGISGLSFSSDGVDTFSTPMSQVFSLGYASSVAYDKRGDVEFLTNGCHVYNSRGFLMSEEYLFPAPTSEEYCPEDEYIGFDQTIFIPKNNLKFFSVLIASNNKVANEYYPVYSDTMKIFKVQSGSSRPVKLLSSLYIGHSEPGALKFLESNTQGEYWIVTHDLKSEELSSHLINDSGEYIKVVKSPAQGSTHYNTSLQRSFSPDGQKYAYADPGKGLRVYDFDRVTGHFTGMKTIPLVDNDRTHRGVQFSPDSRFVYITDMTNLYQVELSTEDIVLIANHENEVDEYNWPINMAHLNLGPDCRIYVSPGQTTPYVHVIHNPDEKGVACNFEWKAIRSLTRISHALPTAPYRPDTDPCLDIPWILSDPPTSTTQAGRRHRPITTFPNPVGNTINLSWPSEVMGNDFTFQLRDGMGRQVLTAEITPTSTIQLDRSTISSGLYFWAVSHGGQLVSSGKLVLE